jgi:hypothetical protein
MLVLIGARREVELELFANLTRNHVATEQRSNASEGDAQ